MKTKILQFVVLAFITAFILNDVNAQTNEMPHIRNIELITKPSNTVLFVGSFTSDQGHEVKIISKEYYAFLNSKMRELVTYSKYYSIEE